ncbi:MAG: hypothetical protein LBP79_05075 [Clostridiales bacterium]|jgi:hypothetical protein|nr:hypothetical protein [Clostridiales bacterium]
MKSVKFTAKQKLKALNMWSGTTRDIACVAEKCKCTERSLWRWKAAYDGSLESLRNKSSRPLTPHPNSHTAEERKNIETVYAEHPDFGYAELYGELRTNYAYDRHPMAMYSYIRKNGIRPSEAALEIQKSYEPKKYDTPQMLGVKWQMDVKFIPAECNYL